MGNKIKKLSVQNMNCSVPYSLVEELINIIRPVRRFKLIKQYYNSPELGTIITFHKGAAVDSDMELSICESNPDFWRELISETRVYMGDEDLRIDKFIDKAEEEGTIFSLKGFEELFNDGLIDKNKKIRIV